MKQFAISCTVHFNVIHWSGRRLNWLQLYCRLLLSRALRGRTCKDRYSVWVFCLIPEVWFQLGTLKNELLVHKCFKLPLVIFFSVKTTLRIYTVQTALKALSNTKMKCKRPGLANCIWFPHDVTMGGSPMLANQLRPHNVRLIERPASWQDG